MKLLWVIVAVALSREFTEEDVERARACLRVSMAFQDHHPTAASDLIAARPKLDPAKLENKLMVDVFENCRKTISASDVVHVKESQGKFDWTRLGKYLAYDPSAYQSEADLAVSEEHLQIRKALMKAERAGQL